MFVRGFRDRLLGRIVRVSYILERVAVLVKLHLAGEVDRVGPWVRGCIDRTCCESLVID